MNTALLVILAATILPTALYVLVFYWADRYEREPLWLLAVAFVWGALPAATVSLLGETALEMSFVRAPNAVANNLLQAVVVAPVVEELAKGLVLIAIYGLLHREFDGLLDGLTYGALVGFGFAMTENFLSFHRRVSKRWLRTIERDHCCAGGDFWAEPRALHKLYRLGVWPGAPSQAPDAETVGAN